jgi:hypothetical protein
MNQDRGQTKLTMISILRYFTIAMAVLALAAGVILLANDMKIAANLGLPTDAISAAPLLLVGVAFLIFQPLVRPRWTELLKNLLLAGTFILWGIIQLMPQTTLSLRLGDLVIALYVLDLAWIILAGLASKPRVPS